MITNDVSSAFTIITNSKLQGDTDKEIIVEYDQNKILMILRNDINNYIKKLHPKCEIWVNRILVDEDYWCINDTDNIKIMYNGVCIYRNKINDSIVKLPLAKPMINTYPYFTGLVAILEAYNKGDIWIFNNFILFWMFNFIYFNEYWADFKFGNEEVQEEFCQQINKKIVYRKDVKNLLEFIIDSINNKKYVFVSIDVFFIDEWWRKGEEKINTKHQVLVCGYNSTEKKIYVSDFMGNNKYETVEMSYDDFVDAYETVDGGNKCLVEFGNDIWLLSINEHITEKIDIQRIYNLCLDSYYGKDIHYKNYLWWERKVTDIEYGICYFDELVRALSNFYEENYEEFDVRPIHILVEFGKVMKKRVKYLLESGLIQKNEKTDKLREMVSCYLKQSLKMQSLSIKYYITNNIILIKKIQEMVLLTKITYKNMLELLISSIEDSHDVKNMYKDIAIK